MDRPPWTTTTPFALNIVSTPPPLLDALGSSPVPPDRRAGRYLPSHWVVNRDLGGSKGRCGGRTQAVIDGQTIIWEQVAFAIVNRERLSMGSYGARRGTRLSRPGARRGWCHAHDRLRRRTCVGAGGRMSSSQCRSVPSGPSLLQDGPKIIEKFAAIGGDQAL